MLNGYKILVYCTSKIHDNNFNYFISAINDDLILHGWRIMIFSTFTDLFYKTKSTSGEAKIFDLINYDIADALFLSDEKLLNSNIKNDILQKAKAHNIPTFIFGGNNPDFFNIWFNQKLGIRKIVTHLIQQHHIHNFHFISGRSDSEHSKLRLESFREVLKENNIPLDESQISYGDFWDVPTKKIVQQIIDDNKLPEAFVCANDAMALATISVLKRNGYKCPRDVIVTGFDGADDIYYSVPKLTTAMCNFQLLGYEVAKFILEVTGSEKEIKPFTKYIEPTLFISESCGCSVNTNANPNFSSEFILNLHNYYNLYCEEEITFSQLSFSIQSCKSYDEISEKLHSSSLYNVMCLLKTECISKENSPNVSLSDSSFGDSMYVLFDSECRENEKKIIKTQDLVPQIDYLYNIKKPIIFIPLIHVELPLGYLVFCFYDYSKENFNRTTQIPTWISNAIFGFRSLQYQQFLQNRIEKMYSLDALTGLYNRTAFLKMFDGIVNSPSFTELSLVMCDLDNLKTINDSFGHSEGDNAIKTAANAFLSSFPDGIFCRYGGDEFLGIFTKKVSYEDIESKISSFLSDYNKSSGKEYKVAVSIGVYNSCEKNFSTLLSHADKLMYKNKSTKKKKSVYKVHPGFM